ncbi:MAG TPA: AAA family ATPase [Solirubrobacterales bacterium]|nr:AAA family ATPase [Solirubrobacterales bacterium]
MDGTTTLFDADATGHTGTVEVLTVTYCAEDRSYAVLRVEDTGSGERMVMVGPVAHLSVGEQAEVSGEWTTHERYGRQLQVRSARPLDPTDREGHIRYLTSLRNIGQARAERLADMHGERVLSAIAEDPHRAFASLPGVNDDQAAEAAGAWNESRAVRDLHVQLAPHGLAHLASPIHAHFGEAALPVLHEDPYRLTEVEGVGFLRADRIALAGGVPPESDSRAQAAAVYVLSEAEQRGHTYLPVDELGRQAGRLLELVPDPDVLVAAEGLLLDEGRAYRRRTHECELAVARTLAARLAAPPQLKHEPAEEPPEDAEGRRLTDEQWAAVRGAFAARLSVLTGGPGVGKTACTKAIVGEAKAAKVSFALCAPTGRAARRLQETTGHEAETIHRMLGWAPGREPEFKPGRPLPADLVVVDESSMLNLRLIEMLLGGLAESTHVVFVGDADQLPPIGAGKPFEDLIASERAPVVRLTQIFRQAAESMITTAAHEINQGRVPHLKPEQGQEHDFVFLEQRNPVQLRDAVVEMVAERAPGRFGVDPIREIQVLAPIYKGPAGINALNEQLRGRLNPDGERVDERFRLGDRLIQTRNSHELGLMNGSIVFLEDVDREQETVTLLTDEERTLTVPYRETGTLRLAYAISVHKSQGCEVPVVVAVCHSSHAGMLTRPLLYTAITRARRACILVGDGVALKGAVRRDDSGRRFSGLADRLRG